MSDTKELLERAWKKAPQPDRVIDSLIRRRARRQRNRRITAAVLALIVALVSFATLVRTFRTVERPANEPTPIPSPSGIFADVGGWIAFYLERPYGHHSIWAVDPTRPNGPEARIQLSDRPGEPLAWSSDGSKLLIWRTREGPVGTPGCPRCSGPDWTGLFVLNADGTETRLVVNKAVGPAARYIYPGGSFSPDGSKVVFGTYRVGMHTVDADGGTPRLLGPNIRHPALNPTFSPDGTEIAYFDFRENLFTLRVMNADGTGDRMLLGSQAVDCYSPHLVRPAWSPDGTHIAFSCDEYGIRVVGADGSGLTTVIPDGSNPYWSPDGSRIAFEVRRQDIPSTTRGSSEMRLAIANADGTHVQVFQYPARAGPWNPLSLSESGDREPATAGDGSGATPLVYAIVLLGVVGVLFLAWRARRRTGAR
jgi:Tol biopolymer transport system component